MKSNSNALFKYCKKFFSINHNGEWNVEKYPLLHSNYNDYIKYSKTKNLDEVKNEFNDLYSKFIQEENNKDLDNKSFNPKSEFELNHQLKEIVNVDNIPTDTRFACFFNPKYVKRKQWIQTQALKFNIGEEVKKIDYLDEEVECWTKVYNNVTKLIEKNTCQEYLENFYLLKKNTGMSSDYFPQIRDISKVLKNKTGFQIVPVAGLLKPRFFLNLLAFKFFPSTQFIRPVENFEYSGEPDILHEIYGHCSLLCNKDFSDFSQEIGRCSLGASDEDLKKLANIYWFTVEYGLVKEKGSLKAYGGGILTSVYEIQYALKQIKDVKLAEYHDLNFDKMQTAYYDYVNLSTNYFVADSIKSMKEKFIEYSNGIKQKKTEKEKVINNLHC